MKDGRIDKIEVNSKTTEVVLLDSVSKLDKLKSTEDPDEQESVFSSELEITEAEKEKNLAPKKDELKEEEVPSDEIS